MIANDRMFELMRYVLANNLQPSKKAFFESIGFNYSNYPKVKNGTHSFGVGHISNAIERYRLDANFFFKKGSQMFSSEKDKPVKLLLQEAMRKL